MKSMKSINYFYYPDNKKYTITDTNKKNISGVNSNITATNIYVNLRKFKF